MCHLCHLCTELNSLDTGKMFYVMEWDHGNKLDSICNTINVQDIKQEISSKLKDYSISCYNLKSIRHKIYTELLFILNKLMELFLIKYLYNTITTKNCIFSTYSSWKQ